MTAGYPVDTDTWWSTLPRSRREQIYRWVEQPSATAETPGQGSVFDILDHPSPKGLRR